MTDAQIMVARIIVGGVLFTLAAATTAHARECQDIAREWRRRAETPPSGGPDVRHDQRRCAETWETEAGMLTAASWACVVLAIAVALWPVR